MSKVVEAGPPMAAAELKESLKKAKVIWNAIVRQSEQFALRPLVLHPVA